MSRKRQGIATELPINEQLLAEIKRLRQRIIELDDMLAAALNDLHDAEEELERVKARY